MWNENTGEDSVMIKDVLTFVCVGILFRNFVRVHHIVSRQRSDFLKTIISLEKIFQY